MAAALKGDDLAAWAGTHDIKTGGGVRMGTGTETPPLPRGVTGFFSAGARPGGEGVDLSVFAAWGHAAARALGATVEGPFPAGVTPNFHSLALTADGRSGPRWSVAVLCNERHPIVAFAGSLPNGGPPDFLPPDAPPGRVAGGVGVVRAAAGGVDAGPAAGPARPAPGAGPGRGGAVAVRVLEAGDGRRRRLQPLGLRAVAQAGEHVRDARRPHASGGAGISSVGWVAGAGAESGVSETERMPRSGRRTSLGTSDREPPALGHPVAGAPSCPSHPSRRRIVVGWHWRLASAGAVVRTERQKPLSWRTARRFPPRPRPP